MPRAPFLEPVDAAFRAPPFFFLRRTFRGVEETAAGAGAGERVGAPSCSGLSSSFGGVRDVRRGGGWAFGIILRVINPWPTVQRFVVTQ